MKIEELKNAGLEREYKISLSSQLITAKVDLALAEKAKTFKLPGFREGKVPLSVVKRHIGSDVLSVQITEFINSSVNALIKEKKIKPAVQPSVNIESFDPESEMVLNIKIDIVPEIPEIKYESIELDSVEVELSAKEVADAEEHFLQMMRSFEKAEDGYAAQKDDVLVLDFDATTENEELTKGVQKDVRIQLGSGTFVHEIEEKLIGIKASEQRNIVVKLPDDYSEPEFAGKEAKFHIVAHEVLKAGEEVAINDELAKKVGLETVGELKELIKQRAMGEVLVFVRMRNKKALFDKLEVACDMELPVSLVKADLDSIILDAKNNAEKEGKLKELEDDKSAFADFEKLAKRRVKLGLIIAAMAEQNDLRVDNEDIQKLIDAQAASNPSKKQEVLDFFSKQENLDKLRGSVIEEKVVDILFQKVKLNKVAVSVDDFMKKYVHDIKGIN